MLRADFQLERDYQEHECTIAHQFSASDCESLRIREVLEIHREGLVSISRWVPDQLSGSRSADRRPQFSEG